MSNSLNSPALRALIKQTLTPLGLYSANAEELLLATCANESDFGQHRVQSGNPADGALGIFQMEPSDHDDIYANYLQYHSTLESQIKQLSSTCTASDLVNNDTYAIALARVHYARCPGNLPDPASLDGLWAYYRNFYNTPEGAAIQSQFMEKYKLYVTDPVAT
jgi:hypothetical protein